MTAYLFILTTYVFFLALIAIPFFRASHQHHQWGATTRPSSSGDELQNLLTTRLLDCAAADVRVYMATPSSTIIPLLIAVLLNNKVARQHLLQNRLFIPVIIAGRQRVLWK